MSDPNEQTIDSAARDLDAAQTNVARVAGDVLQEATRHGDHFRVPVDVLEELREAVQQWTKATNEFLALLKIQQSTGATGDGSHRK